MDESDAFDEEYVSYLTREGAASAFPGERQLSLLCLLSEAKRPLTTAEILSQLQRYDPKFVSSENENLVGPANPAATLSSDIAVINQDAEFIVNRAANGETGQYEINHDLIYTNPLEFSAEEAGWLEAALRFLEGDHTLLLTRILGSSQMGQEDIVDIVPEFRIPATAQVLFEAIMRRVPVTFDYRNSKGKFTKGMLVEPWKLYFHNGYFYLQAHYPDSAPESFYTLHLSRIESEVRILENTPVFSVPNPIPPIDLDSPLSETLLFALEPGTAHELRHKATPVSAAALSALPETVTQLIPAGWELFSVERAGFFDWITLLKEFLGEAVVVSPQWFRDEVIGEAKHLSRVETISPRRVKTPVVKPTKRGSSRLSKDNAYLVSSKMLELAKFLVGETRGKPVEVAKVVTHFGWDETEVRDLVTRLSFISSDELSCEYSLNLSFSGPHDELISLHGKIPDWAKLQTIQPLDAIRLFLGLETLSRYVPPYRDAITTVENKIATIILRSPNLTLTPLGVDVISPEDAAKLEQLWDAIDSRRLVEFEYTNAADELKLDRVAPVVVLAIKGQIYLQGIKQQVRSYPWRLFRLERMESLRCLDEAIPARQPRKSVRKSADIRLLLADGALPQIDQIRQVKILNRDSEGSLFVELKVYDEKWLTRTLLSFGKNLKGIYENKEFPTIVGSVQDTARRALANYQV